ncbi:MAG: diguanylate cyclase [Betaproteobacteria bacterium]|nr:diguanylate cyclase [Betaproteobacteria bacterium]
MSFARVRATGRTPTGTLIAFLSIAALAVMPVVGFLIWSGYQVTIHNAETRTRDYAAILEARLEATLRRADADLWDLARAIPIAALSQRALPRYARELNADLDFRMFNFKEIGGFRVADRHGDTLYTSASASAPYVNVSDRSYFRWLRDNPQAGPVFSEVLTGRSTGRQILAIARALMDGRGNFLGIVYALLELEHFQMQFQSLAIGPQGVVSLRRSDDYRLVLRWPHLAGEVNRPLSPQNPLAKQMAAGATAATLQFIAESDGVERIFSYRALEGYPFHINVSFGRDDVLAQWRARSLVIGALSLSLLGLLAWLLFRLWRTVVRETLVAAELKQCEQALHESEARFRSLTEMSSDFYWESDAEHRLARRSSGGNPSTLSVFQRSAQIGTRPWEVPYLSPDESGWQAHRAARDAHLPFRNFELSRVGTDGTEHFMSISGDPVFDASGAFKGYHGVGTDITARKRAEQALRDSAEKLRLFADNVPAMTVSWDENLRCRFANKAFAEFNGVTVESILGKHLRKVIGEEGYPEIEGHVARALRGHSVSYQRTRKLPNGESRYIEVKLLPQIGDQGKVLGFFAVTTDITEHKLAEQALRNSAEELRLFADNVPAMTTSWDVNLRCRFANKAFAEFNGIAVESIFGKHLREVIGEEGYPEVEGHFAQALQGHPVTYERTRKLQNGESRYIEVKLLPHIGDQGKVLGCFAVTTDITEHKLAEERIQRVAHHDSLTGLPNRMLFQDRLDQAISLAKRDSRQFALLYLDLDRFKPVNDNLGHTAGDELLQAVAARIRQQVRESDTVARVGGDEFTVILPDIARREEAETVAKKIIAAVATPFQLGNRKQRVDIGTSIGIALYPTDARDTDALVKAADAAMYSAKQVGSSFRFCET